MERERWREGEREKKKQSWWCVYRRMADVKALFSLFRREADMCTIFEKVNNGSNTLHFFMVNLYPQQAVNRPI